MKKEISLRQIGQNIIVNDGETSVTKKIENKDERTSFVSKVKELIDVYNNQKLKGKLEKDLSNIFNLFKKENSSVVLKNKKDKEEKISIISETKKKDRKTKKIAEVKEVIEKVKKGEKVQVVILSEKHNTEIKKTLNNEWK